MVKATHLGGSGLEYKPIRPTDYLTSLKPVYDEDKRILKQQHNYLRERDQQMVAAAKQQDDLIMAIGKFAPTLAAYAKRTEEAKAQKALEAAKAEIPCEKNVDCNPTDPEYRNRMKKLCSLYGIKAACKWIQDNPAKEGEDDDNDNDNNAQEPGSDNAQKVLPNGTVKTNQVVKVFNESNDNLNKLQSQMASMISAYGGSIGAVTRDRIINSHGAQRLAYQKALLALTAQRSTPQAFQEELKRNITLQESLKKIPNAIDRQATENRLYDTWFSEQVAPFKPTQAMWQTIIRPEQKRATSTNTNKTNQAIEAAVYGAEEKKFEAFIAATSFIPGVDGEKAAVTVYDQLLSDIIARHGFVDIKGGYTAKQQARNHSAKILYNLVQSERFNKDQLNKLIWGNIDHAGGSNVAQAIWDRDGILYNGLTNEIIKVGVAKANAEKAFHKDNQLAALGSIKTYDELKAHVDYYDDITLKDQTLFDQAEKRLNQWNTPTQIENKQKEYTKAEENGLLLDPDIQKRIERETDPGIKRDMEARTKLVQDRLGATSYEEVRKNLTMVVEQVAGAAIFPGSNKKLNTEQAVDRLMEIWGRNVHKTIEGLKQPDGSYGFGSNIGENAQKDAIDFYKAQGGGNSDPKKCVGMFCFHPELGYTKLNEIDKVEEIAEETANLPYEAIVEDTLKQNAQTMPKYLDKWKSHEQISKNVAGAYSSNNEMLGMLLTGKFSDKFLLQAKYAEMEPNKLFENCLGALVKADPEFAKLHNLTHTLKEVEALNKNGAALTTRIMKTLDKDTSVEALDIKYAVTVTGWDNASPKAKARYLEYMNKSAGTIKEDETKSRKDQIQEKFNTTDVGKARLLLEEAERLQTIGTKEEQVDMKKVKEYQNEMKQEDKQKEIFNPYIAQNTKNQEDKQLSFNLTEGVRIAKTFIDEVNNLT